LQLDSLSVQFNCSDFKVNADGRDKGRRKGIIREPQQEAGFTNARVAD
jgi:hypothetical protein